ncbi:DUF4351 domain-containing protein [Methylococcus sp. Mc7]|uniref:DUF4351 domain-containing protein n=1 Tax=Methylococcus sp. Mc7 TaxID=2860258 RepID=UPI001C528FFD|nr:DUF4351 domain-containing protein [Methylococcus sp. Mc7]QXP84030.1 DUF4351 domain-containing protein [Methylococcus sp. Mc7]
MGAAPPRSPSRVVEWTEKWKQQGLQQGLQQGIAQGEIALLRRQLIRRFGPLPEWVEQRIQQAPPEQLETWAERLLDAESLPAVFEA